MLGTKRRFPGREASSLNNEIIYQVSTHTMSSNGKMKIFCQQSQRVGNVSPAYSNGTLCNDTVISERRGGFCNW